LGRDGSLGECFKPAGIDSSNLEFDSAWALEGMIELAIGRRFSSFFSATTGVLAAQVWCVRSHSQRWKRLNIPQHLVDLRNS